MGIVLNCSYISYEEKKFLLGKINKISRKFKMFRKDPLKIITYFHLFSPLSRMSLLFTRHICSSVWIAYNHTLTSLDLCPHIWRSCGYCWPPVPLKAKVEHLYYLNSRDLILIPLQLQTSTAPSVSL